jgi:hypothetical protein
VLSCSVQGWKWHAPRMYKTPEEWPEHTKSKLLQCRWSCSTCIAVRSEHWKRLRKRRPLKPIRWRPPVCTRVSSPGRAIQHDTVKIKLGTKYRNTRINWGTLGGRQMLQVWLTWGVKAMSPLLGWFVLRHHSTVGIPLH